MSLSKHKLKVIRSICGSKSQHSY